MQGYSVYISQSKLQADVARTQLPRWMRQTISSVKLGLTTFKVYVDGQGLLQREDVSMQMSLGATTLAISENMEPDCQRPSL